MRRLAVAAVLATVLAGCSSPDPFAAYRLTEAEDVPGSFDWSMLPPEDVAPAIDAAEAYRRLPGAGEEPTATVALGRVRNEFDGSVGPTAWLFVTPHLCFATAKGDLVSPGRFGDGDGCTDDNLYVQGVDATTGEVLGGFSAFDSVEGWTPARAGTPAPVEVRTQEGTTRLH
jgi:hypothetical protein